MVRNIQRLLSSKLDSFSKRTLSAEPDVIPTLPELSPESRMDRPRMWLAVGAVTVIVAAAAGFFVGRATVPAQLPASADDADYDDAAPPAAAPAANTPAQQAAAAPARHRSYSHAGGPAGAAVIAAAKPASGLMYVHRMNSDVRAEPSYDAQVLKKEPKGAQVQLKALSDKWAEIQDGGMKGWMRASVLKDTPPGEKRKKKDADD